MTARTAVLSFLLLVRVLACLACFVVSIALVWGEKDGWGWFLFVAVLLMPMWLKSTTTDDD